MDGFTLILATVCLNDTSLIVVNSGVDQVNLTQSELCQGTKLKSAINYNVRYPDIKEEIQENRLESIKLSLNGRHLHVATLDDYPLSYTKRVNGTLMGDGVAFKLLNFIAAKLNFTYDIIVPKNNIIGSRADMNGSLFDAMRQGKIDLAVAFIPLMRDTQNYIEFSSVTLDEGEWILVMRRPEESTPGSGLLAPFEFWVWILILISLLAVGPIIYFLNLFIARITGGNPQKPYSIGYCAWFVYGALMKQGSTLCPIADSTRLLFATWWIFITILTSFYTANLTAFLTLSKFTLPFNTLDDVIKKEKSFVTLRGRGIEYAIKRGDGDTLANLEKMIKKDFAVFKDQSNDSKLLIDYVEKKSFILIRDKPAIDHVLYDDYCIRRDINREDEKIHCPFAKSKRPLFKMNRAFVYPNGSNYKYVFDQELLNLVESGIVKYLLGEKLPQAEICPQNLGGTERQLRNSDLLMTYYIMLTGFAAGTVIFVTELLFRFLNGRHEPIVKRRKRGNIKHVHSITPPPPYGSIFQTSTMTFNKLKTSQDPTKGIKRYINGRNYIVYKGPNGENKLVPVRVPSATLFQYTYSE